MPYAITHNRKAYTPDGGIDWVMTESDVEAYNAAIEAAEIAKWETKPAHMLGYYHFTEDHYVNGRVWLRSFHPDLVGAYITTWRGVRLGTITHARVFSHNFGGRFVSIEVQGSNGARYYGRASWDNGTCINLRRAK